MKTPELKIYALKYGESQFPANYVFHGTAHGKTIPFSWLFYYIEYGDKKILVDTGFNNTRFINMFGIKNYVKPAELLKQNKINPEQITDIILTHAHFDHADGIDSFPGARVIISSDELKLVQAGKYGIQTQDKFVKHGNITGFEDTYSLYDLFIIKKTGGHTSGSSVVYIDFNGSCYCLTGDEVYSKENLEKMVMNGSVVNPSSNMNFIKNYDKKYIPLTFHNPEYYGSAQSLILIR